MKNYDEYSKEYVEMWRMFQAKEISEEEWKAFSLLGLEILMKEYDLSKHDAVEVHSLAIFKERYKKSLD